MNIWNIFGSIGKINVSCKIGAFDEKTALKVFKSKWPEAKVLNIEK